MERGLSRKHIIEGEVFPLELDWKAVTHHNHLLHVMATNQVFGRRSKDFSWTTSTWFLPTARIPAPRSRVGVLQLTLLVAATRPWAGSDHFVGVASTLVGVASVWFDLSLLSAAALSWKRRSGP